MDANQPPQAGMIRRFQAAMQRSTGSRYPTQARAVRRGRKLPGLLRPAWLRPTLQLLAALLYGTGALANDLDVRLEATRAPGTEPTFIVDVHKALERLDLHLTAAPQTTVQRQHGPAAAGAVLRFPLPHPRVGRRRWQGTLTVRFRDGSTGSMPLRFETETLAPLGMTMHSDRADLVTHHRVRVSLDQPAQRIQIEAFDERGARIAQAEQRFAGPPPGTQLEIPFSPTGPGPIVRVRVTGTDVQGRFVTHEAYPWALSVPHEEVVFASGQADIRPSEVPKLERAQAALTEAMGRYRQAVALSGQQIQLFVTGHTDTVGSRAQNRALSRRRARAIASWFRGAGIQAPIHFQGRGEEALRVPTPDETAAEPNRRADYVLAVAPPDGDPGAWQTLPGGSSMR